MRAKAELAERHSSMSKQTIAVDIDDVLAAYAQDWVSFSNKNWGTNLSVADYHEHWAKVWGVDEENWKTRASYYFENADVSNLAHDQDAKSVLELLSVRYHIVVVTSRVDKFKKDSINWINRHYNGIFREIHFAGLWDELDVNTHLNTKAELVSQIGADFLIDDQLKHCISAAEAGVTSLLFGDYPWNQTTKKLPTGVTRVNNWDEVLGFFNEKV